MDSTAAGNRGNVRGRARPIRVHEETGGEYQNYAGKESTNQPFCNDRKGIEYSFVEITDHDNDVNREGEIQDIESSGGLKPLGGGEL